MILPYRVVAGLLELTALTLQAMDDDKEKGTGKIGYVMIMVLYCRGGLIQLQLGSLGYIPAMTIAVAGFS
jgi:hypothetical protein